MSDYPETIIYVDGPGVSVWAKRWIAPRYIIAFPEEGYVKCNYCDIKFMRKKKEDDNDKVPTQLLSYSNKRYRNNRTST